jgi:dipeptidyl aminopeptidase/acylaminoacyl peptidase
VLVTSNFADQRLWDVSPGSPPRPLTPEAGSARSVRFACPAISPDGLWAVAVRERHEPRQGLVGRDERVTNDIVAVSLAGGTVNPRVLAQGHDFYASPELSPTGERLAFVCWDHPAMPWDRTELWHGRFKAGKLGDLVPVAGQGEPESVVQPKWAPDGGLIYASDRSGWWNLYRDGSCLAGHSAEFAGPAWVFGDSDYAVLADGTVLASWRSSGVARAGTVRDGTVLPLSLPYSSFSHLSPAGQGALAVAGGPATAPEVVRMGTDATVEVLRRSRPQLLGGDWVSVGEAFAFATGEGQEAHAVYYPPRNPDFQGPRGEAPPLIVTSHGGPTSYASTVLDPGKQYWTTRGFGVVDVDYRGSTGYGRAYRKALEGRWGVADVEDCAAAAQWMADHGRADPARMVIRGASASGLTVLAALARSRTFAAGAVRYGVADLRSLAGDTHKFESRYIDGLVPSSELEARSPLSMAADVKAPVLFFHGLDDKVVPPDQTRQMASRLRAAGTEALVIEIEGEGHGFRRGSTLVRAQEAELAFYGTVLGFAPGGELSRARVDLVDAARPGGATWFAEPA